MLQTGPILKGIDAPAVVEGINPDIGGYRIYASMRRLDPDFFLGNGDNIYADGVIEATASLPGGRTWRNITTEEKSKVAETLAEYRGNFRYNLLDENLKRFNAQVPSIIQWDDHEVRNNWFPGQMLDDANYTVKSVSLLAARAHARALLAPLSAGPSRVREERLATLAAFLDGAGQAGAAAALGVHRNTVAYRLRAIEAVTGWSLDDPELRLALSLALRLVRTAQP